MAMRESRTLGMVRGGSFRMDAGEPDEETLNVVVTWSFEMSAGQ